MSGTLCVMRLGQDGDRITLGHGGMDPDAVITTIQKARHLSIDGGDW